MIFDPCHSKLVAGIHGGDEGVLTKFQRHLTMHTHEDSTCGYVVWFPSYHDNAVVHGNLFMWAHGNPGYQPKNTADFPFGSDTNHETSTVVLDPTSAFVHSDTCESARTVGACMKVTYTGKMTDSTGMIAPLSNIPLDHLLPKDGAEAVCADVDQLFAFSTSTRRLGIDTSEIVYRPVDPNSERFRNVNDNCVILGDLGIDPTTSGLDARTTAPTGIGFAFRGLTPGTLDSLSLSLFKNIEWKPGNLAGMAPTSQRITGSGGSKMKKVVSVLDRRMPGWSQRLIDTGESALSKLAKTVFTGVASSVGGAFLSVL